MYAYHGSTDGLCGRGLECLTKVTIDTYCSLVGFWPRHGYLRSMSLLVVHNMVLN